jgi:hypothetical protein
MIYNKSHEFFISPCICTTKLFLIKCNNIVPVKSKQHSVSHIVYSINIHMHTFTHTHTCVCMRTDTYKNKSEPVHKTFLQHLNILLFHRGTDCRLTYFTVGLCISRIDTFVTCDSKYLLNWHVTWLSVSHAFTHLFPDLYITIFWYLNFTFKDFCLSFPLH